MPHRPSPKPPSSSPSPSRPQESQIEVLYNTAVQSFVRRDHVKTQATLARLLESLKKKRIGPCRIWYELDGVQSGDENSEAIANDDWIVKTLKLLISSTASLYTDPPNNTQALPELLVCMLPPKPPKEILSYLHHRCVSAYYSKGATAHLLPPQLVSTLILASLKLSPQRPALDFAHSMTESWIASLPDSLILSISPTSSYRPKDPIERKRVESAREGYLKVVELFIGEVLSHEEEWEMARGFLEGEVVMSSKKKETLYKHLRTLESKAHLPSPAPSPSSSLILPSSSDSLSIEGEGGKRMRSRSSRSSSTSSSSSSSSEATARPGTSQRGGLLGTGLALGQRMEQLRQIRKTGTDTGEESQRPGSIASQTSGSGISESTYRLGHSNLTSNPSSRRRNDVPASRLDNLHPVLQSLLGRLPTSLSTTLQSLSPITLTVITIPFPLLIIFTIIRLRRSKPARQQTTIVEGMRGGSGNTLSQVQHRLQRVRAQQRGWWDWVLWYLRWWLTKFAGVWKLGTTITYV
ncbi:hypothetical protein J010_00074 [Cryptococcus neoformans]|nr:hypothetical protein C360_00146 [Cryptococcus neoformans var. grubii Bt15]OXG41854.1 hypothetical protein C359_03270 [Cryptococcus neoformans var. grubii Bt120]OXG55166.1 hypothetical protein C355_00092 [Cryptococcus neoformans var. grubii Th84]OXG89513.1 hypothetical protein C350_00092 [Cryptococcus neoformans var. grubii MW-RSA36]OXH20193.1 hypothetical protein J010_00074 [Cryptococcus neoformans var. grubii]OXL11699.1 hypothetical protein C348_00091 [Cryptococcus neoformans var. grubii G